MQVCPPTGLDGSGNWKNVSVDTSFSFGTLRSTTSAMMEQIGNELENLSAVGEFASLSIEFDFNRCLYLIKFNIIFISTELKRIPKFAGV